MDVKPFLISFFTMFDPAILLGLKLAFVAIATDAIFGWIFAVTRGTFDIRLVPQFLRTNLFPYMTGLLLLAIVSVAAPDYKPLFYFVYTIVIAKFGVEALKDKLVKIFKPANEPPSPEITQ